jgi:hypothetical protein
MIDDSVRTLKHFADLAYLELRHDTSGKRKVSDLFAASGQSINHAPGVGNEFSAM